LYRPKPGVGVGDKPPPRLHPRRPNLHPKTSRTSIHREEKKMWKSVIKNYPEGLEEWDARDPLFLEWVEALTREPWLAALQDLVRWTRIWTGTEEELMEEIRFRVHQEVWDAEDFPSDFSEFRDFYRIAWQEAHAISSGGLHLELFRYDELTKKELKEFYAPGWGPAAPILVERDGAARPKYHYAMDKLLKYQEPLLLAFLILTDSAKFIRNKRQWTGSTDELVEVLLGYYPMPTYNCRGELAQVKWSSYPEREPIDRSIAFFDHSSLELIKHGFLLDPSDHRRFHARMKTCAGILEEVGIKVSKEKVTHRVREPGGEVRKTKRTRWTVEAPPWRH
jgi:hypothetical protein